MRRLAVVLLLCTIAAADGKIFGTEVAVVDIPDQSALLVWEEGRETLVISSAFVGEGNEFAWLIPLPSAPEIAASTRGLFPTLRSMTAPEIRTKPPAEGVLQVVVVIGSALVFGLGLVLALRLRRTPIRMAGMAIGSAMAGFYIFAFGAMPYGLEASLPGGVAVTQKTVGSYETAALQARSASDVTAWLEGNGYRVPSGVEPAIQQYLDEQWTIVAARLRVGSADRHVAHPLAFRFQAEAPIYPMRLTGVGSDRLDLELFVAGPERAGVPGLAVTNCDRLRAGYPYEHPELTKWAAQDQVLTRLHGTLDAAAMQTDLRVGWSEFTPLRPSFYSAGALSKYRSLAPLAAIVLLLGGLFVALLRQLDDPAGSISRRFGAAILIALLAAGALGATYVALPRGETRIVAPHRRDYGLHYIHQMASDLQDEGALTLSGLRGALREGDVKEFDGPGGFSLERDEGGVLWCYAYRSDGSVRRVVIGPESGR